MSQNFDWTLLSFQPFDCRPFRSISAYSGPFAPDFAPGFAPGNLAQRQSSLSWSRCVLPRALTRRTLDIQLEAEPIRIRKQLLNAHLRDLSLKQIADDGLVFV